MAKGWKLNDVIRVPNAGCPAQAAVVRVWRLPADNQPPELDGQGQARIYLQDAKQQAAKRQDAEDRQLYRADANGRQALFLTR